MKARLVSGEEREFSIGSALTGHSFESVTITSTDALKPEFVEWFVNTVMGRFGLPSNSMKKLPNPISAELYSLHLAVRRLVRAEIAYAERGAGHPEDYVPIEQERDNAESNYLYRLRKVNDVLRKAPT